MSTENDSIPSLLVADPKLLDGNFEDDQDDDDLFVRPQKKHKVLVLSDHPLTSSGVAVQTRVLLDGLIKTGKYTFRCLGGALKHSDYRTIQVNEDFIVKPVNGFGDKALVRQLLITEKPDAVLIFTDPRQFIWLWEMEDEIRQVCPITYWHVWDNDPYPAFNSVWYESTDLINCISQKTFELVAPHFPEKTNYVPHTFPKEMYYPVDTDTLSKTLKQNFQERADWFKVLWVNRNAHRKMPADLLVAWGEFLKEMKAKHGHDNAMLIMHTDPNDIEGPNLLAVAEQLGLHDHVWFSTDKLEFQDMNMLHNMSDCLVNISKAEGFGLSSLISLQVGKPIVVLKTGGETSKVVDHKDNSEHGVALKPVKRSLIGSQMVPYIYEDFCATQDVVDGLMTIFEMSPTDKIHMANKVKAYVEREFDYSTMISQWDISLESCIQKHKRKSGGAWTCTEVRVRNTSATTPTEQSKASQMSVKTRKNIKKVQS